jgi:hypothetical protein
VLIYYSPLVNKLDLYWAKVQDIECNDPQAMWEVEKVLHYKVMHIRSNFSATACCSRQTGSCQG